MDILVLKVESLKTRYPSLLLAIKTYILDNHVNSQKKPSELLLIWQLSPDQPVGHSQLLMFPLSVQVPPF